MEKSDTSLSNGLSGLTSKYVKYVRPMTGKLLRGLALDIQIVDGEGDYLFVEYDGKKEKIIDLTGGYGSNFLGHKNKNIQKIAIDAIKKGPPSNIQGSVRKSAAILGEKISDLLTEETGSGHWISHYSNSGAEAVESAIKAVQIYFEKTCRSNAPKLGGEKKH